MKTKNVFHVKHRIIGTTRFNAAAFGSVTPLLQPDHFKSHCYGPVVYISTPCNVSAPTTRGTC